MRFLMLVCRDESIEFTTEQRAAMAPAVQAWVAEMEDRGVRLQGEVLAPVQATTTVRVRGGEAKVTQGPRLETTEPVSGFNLIECADVDEAVEVSAKHPIAEVGAIELRPFAES
jgi:hypothetical protein